MLDDVIINKSQVIERCIQRILCEYEGNPDNLANITRQDSIVLNLQRACEASIALAMHIVAEQGLGIPMVSREAFDILAEHHYIDEPLAGRLKAMVGFRNIAVHDYQKLELKILQEIIEKNLDDLKTFTQSILKN
jgi:uncharacterized protein YutE (UPF0331/DUF86 family)